MTKSFDGMLLAVTQDYINRFWQKVDKRSDDECWEWLGARSSISQYGIYGKPTKFAHRVAYTLFYGKLPANLYVCHKCDHPWCVNPHHLFSGTASDNVKDRNSKGRSNLPFGIKHKNAKFTDKEIYDIRDSYAKNLFNQYELARIFDVHVMTINDIIHRRTWNHV